MHGNKVRKAEQVEAALERVITEIKRLGAVREVSLGKGFGLNFDNSFPERQILKITCNNLTDNLRHNVEDILKSHALEIGVEYLPLPDWSTQD